MDFEILCKSHETDDKGHRTQNPEWLDLRKTGVTASEAAGLLAGKSPMGLWTQKTGRSEPDDLSGNERVRWGNLLEAQILHAYSLSEYANRPTDPSSELCRSTEFPWLLATLDAWTEHPTWGRIPLDAKNTDKYMATRWEDGPPEAYAWQITQQAIVTGKAGASIVCLIGGNQLVWDDLEVIAPNKDRLLDVTERFWWCVKNDVPPTEIDGLPETRKALNLIYDPKENRIALAPNFVDLDNRYAALVDAIKESKKAIKEVELERDKIENTIRAAMKDNACAELPNGVRYTLKRITRKPFSVTPKPYNKFTRKAARRS